MTQQEWRDLADELERFADDYAAADAELRPQCAESLVDRVRMLVATIRDEFPGN